MKNLMKVATVALMVFSCAQSVERVALPPETNPKALIATGDQNLQIAYSNQWDVLAHEDLMKSASHLRQAKQYDRDGKNQAKAVDELGYHLAYHNRAHSTANQRMTKFQGLLAAREATLNSGIQQSSKENKEFAKLDSEFRDLADDSSVDAEESADLQKKYLALAATMKKNTALAFARKQVEEARLNRASENAPSALNMAELDIKSAEGAIDANQNRPDAYQASIDKANRSAAYLAAIVAEQKRANFKLDEANAKRIIQQKGMIAKMESELAASKAQLSNSRADYIATQIALENSKLEGSERAKELTEKEKELAEKEKLLTQAEADKKFNMALEAARKQFSATEADVYRQGDRLLIRLKTIGFASGEAQLPDTSRNILDKVTNVAKELTPKEIVVEGHTDSVGTAEINDQLSKRRADTVATYLKEQGMEQASIESVGFGFQKPLSSNKSKEGRAQNRRVDIWITPEGIATTAAPTSTTTPATEQDASKTE